MRIKATWSHKCRKRLKIKEGRCDYCGESILVTNLLMKVRAVSWLEHTCAECFVGTITKGELVGDTVGGTMALVVSPTIEEFRGAWG